MRIVFSDDTKSEYFKDVAVGEMFCYTNFLNEPSSCDAPIYMRIEGDSIAVDLRSGLTYIFDKENPVKKITGHLVIET